jgi:hypothetical protein
MVEPLAGWRHVQIRPRRTKQDCAACLQWLADERYPSGCLALHLGEPSKDLGPA